MSISGIWRTLHWSGTSFNTDHETSSGTDDMYAEGSVDVEARTVTITYNYHDQSATDGDYTDAGYTYTNLPIANSTIQYPWVEGFAAGASCAGYVSGISYTGFRDEGDPEYNYNFWCTDFSWTDDPAGDLITVSFKTGL
jgi:hypothetical protein